MAIEASILAAEQAFPAGPSTSPLLFTSTEARRQARLLQVLADPTRLQILSLLSRTQEAVCVGDIAKQFPLKQPTISHHLRLLRDAGMVGTQKYGLYVHYSALPENIAEARQALTLLCLQHDGQA